MPEGEVSRIRGISLIGPGAREDIIYGKHFNLLGKFSHVFIPKHPSLLRENNTKCKLLKAASLYFASKLFVGKNLFGHQKPHKKLNSQTESKRQNTPSVSNRNRCLLSWLRHRFSSSGTWGYLKIPSLPPSQIYCKAKKKKKSDF